MGKQKYVSKKPDPQGHIVWESEEDGIWRDLVTRQLACIQGRACQAYIDGLAMLTLPTQRVPQLHEINQVLKKATGWECVAVPALINFDRFFSLLSRKQFPVATFLRTRAEFDYLQEPDFFHEVFGHCAMLTNPAFAAFTQKYGQLGYQASASERVYLARLYWFSVEFGLLKQPDGLRIYGGGILSSPGETLYALGGRPLLSGDTAESILLSGSPRYKPFDPVDMMRTPYRIDVMQPVYFILDDIAQLYELAQQDMMSMVSKARAAGLHVPLHPPRNKVEQQAGNYV